MKKIAFVFILFIFSGSLYSQGWLEVGLKGGYGLDFLLNKNISSNREISSKLSTGYMYGGKLAWNFNMDHAITLDILSSAFNQTYQYSDSSKNSYNRSIGFTALDFLLMYRHTQKSSYFEIGPQYSTITSAKGSDSNPNVNNMDVPAYLVKSYYSAVIGFGGMLAGTENYRLSLGFRFSYVLNDVVNGVGKLANFPFQSNNAYAPSNPLTALLVMEFSYDVGYFATSKCKKRKTSFLLF